MFHSEFILNYTPDEIKNNEFGEHVRFQNAAEFGRGYNRDNNPAPQLIERFIATYRKIF